MEPIDAQIKNPFPGEDPIEMLRAMVMAFMVLLSKQPNMGCEFSLKELREFPYECFDLNAFADEVDGSQTFMLTSRSKEKH